MHLKGNAEVMQSNINEMLTKHRYILGGVKEGAGSGRINNDKNTNFISMATQSHSIVVLT